MPEDASGRDSAAPRSDGALEDGGTRGDTDGPGLLSRTSTCGEAATRPEQVATPEPSPFSFDKEPCVIHDARGILEDSWVHLASNESLYVIVTDASVYMVPPAAVDGPWRVRVRGTIDFDATAKIEGLGVTLRAEIVPQIMRAGTEVFLSKVQASGQYVTATAELGDLRVDNVRVRCNTVRTMLRPWRRPQRANLRLQNRWRPKEQSISLFPAPNSDNKALFQGEMELSRIGTRDEWIRLSASYNDGTLISGWAKREFVEQVPATEGTGGWGEGIALCGERFGSTCPGYGTDKHMRWGRARVMGGTAVHSAPDGPVWAKVPTATELKVTQQDGSPWVLLEEIPGIRQDLKCPRLTNAFVSEDRVRWVVKPQEF